MNRGAVVGFLVLAALVGGAASLRDQDLTAIGERLIAVQDAIDAASTYRPIPRLQTASARLAFFEEMDYYSPATVWDDPYNYDPGNSSQPVIWDDPYNYDPGPAALPVVWDDPYNYDPYPADVPTAWQSGEFDIDYTSFDPQQYPGNVPAGWQSGEFDIDYSGFDPNQYPANVPTAWESSEFDIDYTSFDSQQYPANVPVGWQSGEYDIDYTSFDPNQYPVNVPTAWQSGEFDVTQWQLTPAPQDPDGYGVVVTPSGTPYPQVDLSTGAPVRPQPTVSKNDMNQVYAPARYEVTTYTPSMYEITTYTPGVANTISYEPAWYERAFPGWGSAVVPLLPSQYRPGYGDCYGYGSNGALLGGLSLSNSGFGVSLGLGGGNPCGGYAPYLSVAPTMYGSATYDQARGIRPSCSISLADSTVDYGGTAIITWTSQGATSASLNGVGTVSLSGSRALPDQIASRTIGITVTGPGGTGACYAALAVNPQQPPTCQISVNPTSIKKGETANLAWIATNATEAALSGLGTVPLQSGRVVSPSSDTTFTLAVKNAANRTATCSVKIDVQ